MPPPSAQPSGEASSHETHSSTGGPPASSNDKAGDSNGTNAGTLPGHTGLPGQTDPANTQDGARGQDEDDRAYASSGDESDFGIVLQGVQDQFRGRPVPSLEERIRKSGRRMDQSKAFTQLLQDRLLYLESTIKRLLHQEEKPVIDQDVPEILPNELQVEHLSWSEFHPPHEIPPEATNKRWKHRPELDTKRRPIVELLVEEAPFAARLRHRKAEDLSYLASARKTDSNSVLQNANLGDGPYRIRLRSPLLLRTLKSITNINTTTGPHKHRLLFLQPFKLLVKHADDIKKHLDQHRKACNGMPPVGPSAETDCKYESAAPNEAGTSEALEALQLLHDIIELHLRPKIDMFRGLAGLSLESRVAFSDLWYLFRPGMQVRTPGKNQIQLYRVCSVTGGRPVLSVTDRQDDNPSIRLKDKGYSSGCFIITCFWIGFDGEQFGPVYENIIIRSFGDRKPMTTLPVYPVDYDPKMKQTLDTLKERGAKFTRLSNPKKLAHKYYAGMTLNKHPEKVESMVMIDFRLAFNEQHDNRPKIDSSARALADDQGEVLDRWIQHPQCDRMGCCGNDYIHMDYDVDDEDRHAFRNQHKSLFETYKSVDSLTADHKVLLPPQLYGFVLRSRRWATLDIDAVNERERDDNEKSWNNLVIDKNIKNTVLALVKNHERPHDRKPDNADSGLASIDLIKSKGRGLIMLLHGEPGVGKTSTAECVAEYTRRPLFPITCGDIGDNAKSVEASLEKNFQLAHKWGCVLLLDEADIFLSKRSTSDITRNSIVSVFLRTLEYYSGILFLTTNRVGNIDPAFKSRIHLSLYYPSLNRNRTIKIWRNNLDTLRQEFEEDGKHPDFRDDEIITFAKQHFDDLESSRMLVWNGRQIRNAFQTAIAIANHDAKDDNHIVLRAQQFKQVAEIALKFDEYLRDVYHGRNDAQLARDAGSRYDDWWARLQTGAAAMAAATGRVPPIPPPSDSFPPPARGSRGGGGAGGRRQFEAEPRKRTWMQEDSEMEDKRGGVWGAMTEQGEDDDEESEFSERDKGPVRPSKKPRGRTDYD